MFTPLRVIGILETKAMRAMSNLYMKVIVLVCACVLGWCRIATAVKTIPIAYPMPTAGQVSLAVYDKQGKMVRAIVQCVPRRAGLQTEWWDGCDSAGKPVPPGSYTTRAIVNQGLTTTPVLSPGPARGLLETGQPCGVVTGDDTRYFLYTNSVVAVGMDGQVRWQHAVPMSGLRIDAGATDGKYLYLTGIAQSNGAFGYGLICLQAVDGALTRFSTGQQSALLLQSCTEPANILPSFTFRTAEQASEPAGFNGHWWWRETDGAVFYGMRTAIVAVGGKLYISLNDAVAVCNAETGVPEGMIPVNGATGLCWTGGTLLCAAGSAVMRIDPATKAVTPFLTTPLQAPTSLTTDRQGNIYVADWGKAMCVRQFTADGLYLRSIGASGGRAWFGHYDREGLLLPCGLAMDAQDQLWVTDGDPAIRRLSLWSTDGKLLREEVTPESERAMLVNPARAERLILGGVEWTVDWAARKAEPAGIAFCAGRTGDAQLLPSRSDAGRAVMAGERERWIFDRRHGDRVIVCEYRDGRLIPQASCRLVAPRTALPQESAEKVHETARLAVWVDQNGDGQAQRDEMTVVPIPANEPLSSLHGAYVGKGWALYIPSPSRRILKVPLTGWTPGGAPRWDPATMQVFATGIANPDGTSIISGDGAGNLYVRSSMLIALSPTGKVRWKLPLRNTPGEGVVTPGNPGDVLPGTSIGDVLFLDGKRGHFITADGLIVGAVAPTSQPGRVAWRDPVSGKVYLGANTPAPTCYEVTGWNQMLRMSGAVSVGK